MILLIPFLLLILSAVSILVIKRLNINLGRIWLVATILSLLNWIVMFAFHWFLPLELNILNWFPFANFYAEGIKFSLEASSWSIGFALASIQLAIIVTDSTRLEELPSVNVWAGIFLINAIGIMAVMSASLMTIILLWTLIDIVELFVVAFTVKSEEHINIGVVAFAVKLAGTFFFIAAIFSTYSKNLALSLPSLAQGAGTLLLIAIGLRLGVLPFNLPYSKEIPLRIGMGTTIRMVGVASSLIVLIRIVPALSGSPDHRLLFFLTMLSAIVAALMWMASKDELSGRPFWVIALSSLSIQSALVGNVEAGLVWSLNLLLVGSVIFLFSNRDRRILFLPLLAIVGLSGLPFTPSAAGWSALVGQGVPLLGLSNLLTIIFLMLGYFRHALHPAKSLVANEKWIWVIFPTGLFFLLLTQWLIFLLSGFDWLQVGVVWASLIAFLIPIVTLIVLRRMTALARYSEWLVTLLNKIGDLLISILGLNWLYRSLWLVFGFIQRIINLFSNLLESQSGLVWVMVLIAALLGIIQPGDRP